MLGVLALVATLLWQSCAAESTCDLYIAPSLLVGSGLGVYAGRAFHIGEEISGIPVVAYSHDNTADFNWQIDMFTYQGYTPTEAILAYGTAMMFNSHKNDHVAFHFDHHENEYLHRLHEFQVCHSVNYLSFSIEILTLYASF